MSDAPVAVPIPADVERDIDQTVCESEKCANIKRASGLRPGIPGGRNRVCPDEVCRRNAVRTGQRGREATTVGGAGVGSRIRVMAAHQTPPHKIPSDSGFIWSLLSVITAIVSELVRYVQVPTVPLRLVERHAAVVA
ncbi:hypothetical protein D9619_012824 [Psilocybe cf. subviscida]|uniref:Uncharacterized protein n=1 Tax=Psilocybe cf. subviscida TaxID=2480587 RepID=A0A8H5ER06_9AGAR|nr:hypothetical protein D9619_012824 [Psilocybe cf. subviscida]